MKPIKDILAETIYTPAQEIHNGVIPIVGHRIAKVAPCDQVKIPAGAAVINNADRIIVPGFIGLHIHSAAGYDLMEASFGTVAAVSRHLARHGITSIAATTGTARPNHTLHAAKGVGEIIRASKRSKDISHPMRTPIWRYWIRFLTPHKLTSAAGRYPSLCAA